MSKLKKLARNQLLLQRKVTAKVEVKVKLSNEKSLNLLSEGTSKKSNWNFENSFLSGERIDSSKNGNDQEPFDEDINLLIEDWSPDDEEMLEHARNTDESKEGEEEDMTDDELNTSIVLKDEEESGPDEAEDSGDDELVRTGAYPGILKIGNFEDFGIFGPNITPTKCKKENCKKGKAYREVLKKRIIHLEQEKVE